MGSSSSKNSSSSSSGYPGQRGNSGSSGGSRGRRSNGQASSGTSPQRSRTGGQNGSASRGNQPGAQARNPSAQSAGGGAGAGGRVRNPGGGVGPGPGGGGGRAASVHSGPGAFSVDSSSGATTVYRVNVPEGVQPGQEFQVYAGSRRVRVRCPPNIRPGQALQITVPAEPTVTWSSGIPQMVQNSSDAPVDMPAALRNQQQRQGGGAPPGYMVTIPPGVEVGQQFQVTVNGQQLMVTCPPRARPGMQVRINPPAPPPSGANVATNLDRPPEQGRAGRRPRPKPKPTTQMFEVVVPNGVRPGQPFALMAGGQRVLVTCPTNAGPGQKIRFQLPINLNSEKKGSIESVRLSYDKDGWTRTIRVSDMKFQWIRMDDKGDVAQDDRFDAKKSAYVRKLDFIEGVDARMRSGNLSLVPATEAVVDSNVRGPNGQDIVTYAEIASAQIKSFEEKAEWFHDTCRQLRVEWEEGHMRVNVRREYLLNDSMMAVMSLGRKDMRKIWKFDFIGEEGIDAGGLAREWFKLVTDEIFNPDNGLWSYSAANQMCMQINPASELLEDYTVYFRFLGRVLGKALFDQQIVSGHMIRHLYKHLLGWPINFDDLELVDEDIYNSLNQMKEIDDVEMLCLDFTSTEDYLGTKKEVELVKGGADIDVTNDNLPEYLECCLKYRMLGRVKPQLTELLLGFFDVLPEPLLTVFDFQELELLMCGLPTIDVEDWKQNTEYTGEYEHVGGDNQVCNWFWEVVSEDFDQERKARLLQFVTGTSGVPALGFSVLQGDGGNIRKFTIHGVKLGEKGILFPRAHTCFNRLDLPNYTSKEQLHDKLKLALEMAATGFDIE